MLEEEKLAGFGGGGRGRVEVRKHEPGLFGYSGWAPRQIRQDSACKCTLSRGEAGRDDDVTQGRSAWDLVNVHV